MAGRAICQRLQQLGHEVLTTHLLTEYVDRVEAELTEEQVYRRDLDWLSCCDVLIAEASGSSYGVGFEVGYVIGRARDTTRPWNGCGPKPSVASLIERFLMDTSNRMALLRMSSFVTASICPRRSNFRRSFPPGQVRGGEM